MPTYTVARRTWLSDECRFVEVGSELEYEGVPGANLNPVDAEARKRKDQAERVSAAAKTAADAAAVNQQAANTSVIAAAVAEALRQVLGTQQAPRKQRDND